MGWMEMSEVKGASHIQLPPGERTAEGIMIS
jgi:hypothetical protein